MSGIRTASHAKDQVKDQVSPTLHRAQETLTDTVLPAIRDALLVARERSGDLLDSDRAHEARRRSRAVVRAARGDTMVTSAPRRWRFGLGMLALGGGIGYGLAWFSRRMTAPLDTYATGNAMSPAPSGTDGGTTTTTSSNGSGNGAAAKTPHAPSGTPTRDINLSAGAPTNF